MKKSNPIPSVQRLEESVISALLVDSQAYWIAMQCSLTLDDFYNPKYRMVYEAMQKIAAANGKIDLVTVANILRPNIEAGLIDFLDLSEMTNKAASSANIEYHIRCLQQCTIKRNAYIFSFELQKMALDSTLDSFELLENSQKKFLAISNVDAGQPSIQKTLKTIHLKAMGEIDAVAELIPYGLTCIDNETGGGRNKRTILVIGGDSGSGKTAAALQFLIQDILLQKAVIFLSYEMKADELLLRIISCLSQVPMKNIEYNRMDSIQFESYQRTVNYIESVSHLIHFVECAGLSMEVIRAKCYMLKMKYNIQEVFLDYVQAMTIPKGLKDANLIQTENCRQIAQTKQLLDVSFILLSQLRKGKTMGRPCASDLMGAQALEAMATDIMLIDHLEKRGITQFDDGTSTAGFREVYFDKCRTGNIFNVRLEYKGWNYTFFSLMQKQDDLVFAPQSKLSIGSPTVKNANFDYVDGEELPF